MRVSFLWHLHQPCYRTADGVAHAPWVALHAGGSYATLVRAIVEAGGRGQVLNLVPTLLEQLVAYRDRRVVDPVLDALTRPSSELEPEERQTLASWARHVTPRQLARFPRLAELTSTDDSNGDGLGPGELRDLQVLFVLAQAGGQASSDDRLASLCGRGGGFGDGDHAAVCEWLGEQPGELLDLLTSIAGRDGVEIATSPYAHPIMPLLIDTAVVGSSWAPHPPPAVPRFQHPDDARWQLATALEAMRAHGFEPVGCWPPEGSVSAAAVELYAEAGARWLVTDEGILERSLGHGLRNGEGASAELYRPWRLDPNGPLLFFRDRILSDRVGFVYGRWEDERAAARDLLDRLEAIAHRVPDDATVVIALDGENPWLHYADGGGRFLRELFVGLAGAAPTLVPATLSELVASCKPSTLPRLHPGSWIGGVFATWIGHPEKSHGWEVLGAVREALSRADARPPSLLLAEGSDWFWWLGDDNPTPLAPLYDRIFRHHLRDACDQAGIEPPIDLDRPLKRVSRVVTAPISGDWRPPDLDGRVTSYFEWSLATVLEGAPDRLLRRLALWGDGDRLFLLVVPATPASELLERHPLTVALTSPAGDDATRVVLGPSPTVPPQVAHAVGTVVELSIPWRPAPGWRLEVRLGPSQLPEGGVSLLEPTRVDG